MRYVALLKGINVGGKNKIKMLDLISLFQDLGFENVKTYIQSGNVIFDSNIRDTINLENQIEEKINETFGFLVKTIIRTAEELRCIINNNPFTKEPNIEIDKLHLTLLIDIPDSSIVELLDVKKEENEKFVIVSREVYLYCPNGYGNTKLTNTLFEKKLKTVATTRNWKTINNIFENMQITNSMEMS